MNNLTNGHDDILKTPVEVSYKNEMAAVFIYYNFYNYVVLTGVSGLRKTFGAL